MSDEFHIPLGSTGKERRCQLVKLERIRCEMRALVLMATADPRKNLPEFYDWAHDLRRGRTNVLGGLFRLIDVIHRRGMGAEGRRIAEGLLVLAYEYMDAMLPETPAPTPAAEPVPRVAPLRLDRSIRAIHSTVWVGRRKAA